MTASSTRAPSMLQALTPLLFLVVLLVLGIVLFADDAVYGASQIALLLASGVAALVGLRNGMRWKEIEEALVHGVSLSVGAILILLAVGALIGSWLLSGTVPTLIVYGMKLLHPSYFYPAACLISLLLASGVAALVGLRNGMRWKEIEEALVHGVSLSVGAILILLAVGALIGSWLLSGTVPTLIVYGMKLLHPSYFYPAACLICAVTSLVIGSSWTTAGTVGVALVGIAQGMDMSLPIT